MPDFIYFMIFPVVGAMVGWITNRIAIRMLFKPRKPVNILGLKIQGVIPRRHGELAMRIAETVHEKLLTSEDLGRAMNDVDWEDEVRDTLHNILNVKGPGSIIGKIPGVAQAWESVVLPQILETLTKEVSRLISRYRDVFIQKLKDTVDIKQLVAQRVEEFELEALESLVMNLASKEFKHIEIVGAVTGTVIGFVQGLIMILIG
jgi:uncharacterized membrane protein YheB (UPF0754 family)